MPTLTFMEQPCIGVHLRNDRVRHCTQCTTCGSLHWAICSVKCQDLSLVIGKTASKPCQTKCGMPDIFTASLEHIANSKTWLCLPTGKKKLCAHKTRQLAQNKHPAEAPSSCSNFPYSTFRRLQRDSAAVPRAHSQQRGHPGAIA